jgi:hypothetical protein
MRCSVMRYWTQITNDLYLNTDKNKPNSNKNYVVD